MKLGSSRGMDTKPLPRSERSKPSQELRLTPTLAAALPLAALSKRSQVSQNRAALHFRLTLQYP